MKSVKRFISLSLFLFSASTLCGYFLGERWLIGLVEVLDRLEPIVFEMGKWNLVSLVAFIFINNSLKFLLAIILGALFGVFPLLFLTVNGMLIGLVIFQTEQVRGLPFALTTIIPHGVIEIPLIIICSAVGFHLGNELMKKMQGGSEIRMEIEKGIRFFARRILPLSFLAAMVEVFITPRLMVLLF